MSKFVVKTNGIANFIFTFSKLNFYWIIFSVLGLGVFGVFPSTMALIKMFKKTNDNYYDITFKSYFKTYKEIFVKSNKVAVYIYLITIAMNVNLEIFNQNSSSFPIIVPILFISSNLLLLLVGLWVVPIIVDYNYDVKSKLRISLILSISQMKSTLYFILMLVFIMLVTYYIPAFALFYAGSIISYIYYKIIYIKIDDYAFKTYSLINKG